MKLCIPAALRSFAFRGSKVRKSVHCDEVFITFLLTEINSYAGSVSAYRWYVQFQISSSCYISWVML